jgi:uncharacterized protein (DUF2342 family)
MWTAVTAAVGAQKRDGLWNHPDLLPTSEDIDNPSALIARLQESQGDAMDEALRKLLD